tara:strand:- start:26 stop:211 length:186 start_codon:yes stop_codon:yes gene_type:complete
MFYNGLEYEFLKLRIMTIMISLIGFLIFTALWFGLDNIKIELRYRNTLLKEQNKILKDRGK